MHEVDDWELVARAQAGDDGSFAALVKRYQKPVVHFCQRMVQSHQDAEDLAQETFVRLHRHLKRLQPAAKFSTLLFGIARNLTLNHLRNAKRRGCDASEPLDARPHKGKKADRPDAEARRREIEAVLAEGIALLSAEHREVLLLREMHGLDYESIAKVVKCRKGTVRSRLARAREQLRERLTELGGDLI